MPDDYLVTLEERKVAALERIANALEEICNYYDSILDTGEKDDNEIQ